MSSLYNLLKRNTVTTNINNMAKTGTINESNESNKAKSAKNGKKERQITAQLVNSQNYLTQLLAMDVNKYLLTRMQRYSVVITVKLVLHQICTNFRCRIQLPIK